MLDQAGTPSSQTAPRGVDRLADPCAMVIFGATGDLTKRLMIPALYNLSRTEMLPEHFALIGVSRAEGTAEAWRSGLYEGLKNFLKNASSKDGANSFDEAAWNRLANKMSYIQGDLAKPELYDKIRASLDALEKDHGTRGNAIFYLAVAGQLFGSAVDQLGASKLTDQHEDKDGKPRFWRRVVFEKPFGHGLDSARALNKQIQRTLHEDQFSGLITFLEKTRFRTLWHSVLPTGFLNRFGIAIASITCGSAWRRPLASSSAANSMR